jgi:hypothetical protein
MGYLVFSQDNGDLPDVERLAGHASRFFGAKLENLGAQGSTLRVRLSSLRPSFDAELTLRAREVTRSDLEDAREAEARGRAAGMGALAERCGRVWELDRGGEDEPGEIAYLTLAAICASVALGPVLPPDHATLFGVRGAIERRERLEKAQER